jgi:hypothetical protein
VTLYLHIGCGKTGSTSIQVFLEANDKLLREKGYVVPTSAGRRNHRRLTLYAQDDHVIDNLRRSKGYTTPEKVIKFRARFREEFLAEAATWPADATILMTSEQLSRLRTQTALERLKLLLDEISDDIRIIVYFRRQDGMILSEYSQFIKGGKTTLLADEIEAAKTRKQYNYFNTANLWARIFGIDKVIVRPFEREQMVGGDTVIDYLSIIKINDLSPFVRPKEQNHSLDSTLLEYLRQMNGHLPRWSRAGRNADRAGLAEYLEQMSDGAKLKLASAEAKAFVEHFSESNASLARTFLGRPDGQLFVGGYGNEDEVKPGPLTVDQVVEISARLYALTRAAAENDDN